MGNILGSRRFSKEEIDQRETADPATDLGETNDTALPARKKKKKSLFKGLELFSEESDTHKMSISLQPTVKQTASVSVAT